jgi:WD40 repeat protein
LYDARNYTGGAFSELQVSTKDMQTALQANNIPLSASSLTWNSISFNVSGNRMLVEADPGLAIVLDGFEGTIQNIFSGGQKSAACFTPDDHSLVLGTDSGTIQCLDLNSGSVVRTLEGHKGPVGAIACNPKYAQLASSCTNTCLWIW